MEQAWDEILEYDFRNLDTGDKSYYKVNSLLYNMIP